MCIIVAKEKNVSLPSEATLETCFKKNPDGAGLMYVSKGKVVIDKGYMTYKSFKKHYDKLCQKYNNFENKSLVLHFRIGTDGSNTPKNTHPFMISNSYTDMQKQYMTSDLGMAHNGIIKDYRPSKDQDVSDTMKFIKDFINPLKENWKDFYKNDNMLKAIQYITNSKVVFLDKDDNLYYSGYFTTDNGIKYSNNNYKEYSSKYTYSKYYDVYDYEEKYPVWHYNNKTNEYTRTAIKNGTKKDDDIERFNMIQCKIGTNVLTEDGRHFEITKNYYYYDKFSECLFIKNDKNEYKLVFKNCTIWNNKEVAQ